MFRNNYPMFFFDKADGSGGGGGGSNEEAASKAPAPDAPAKDASAATEVTVDSRLAELGVNSAHIDKIKGDLGVESVDDLTGLTEADLTEIGMKKIPDENQQGIELPWELQTENPAEHILQDLHSLLQFL